MPPKNRISDFCPFIAICFDNNRNKSTRKIIRSLFSNVNFTLLVFVIKYAKGGVAQLGERRVRNAKVGSSNLLVSTIQKPPEYECDVRNVL